DQIVARRLMGLRHPVCQRWRDRHVCGVLTMLARSPSANMARADEVLAALKRCRPAFVGIAVHTVGGVITSRSYVVPKVVAFAMTALAVGGNGACAETLSSVLAKAFQNNPQLNAQRAFVRQTGEQVNVALSGYQPKISVTASGGPQYTDSKFSVDPRKRDRLTGASVGVTATQPLFDVRTPSQVQAAQGNVPAAREVLRVMAQRVMVDATTAYMNVLRDTGVVHLQRYNVEMLEEQLRHTRQRLLAREVTTTDVSQTESRLAGARWQR